MSAGGDRCQSALLWFHLEPGHYGRMLRQGNQQYIAARARRRRWFHRHNAADYWSRVSLDRPNSDSLLAGVSQNVPGFRELGERRVGAELIHRDRIDPRTFVRFETDAEPKA